MIIEIRERGTKLNELPNVHEHRYEYGVCVGCGMPFPSETVNEDEFGLLSSTTMRMEDALNVAITKLDEASDPQAKEAAVLLRAIVAQRGCSEFDPAIRDGKLTSLIELVIFG